MDNAPAPRSLPRRRQSDTNSDSETLGVDRLLLFHENRRHDHAKRTPESVHQPRNPDPIITFPWAAQP